MTTLVQDTGANSPGCSSSNAWYGCAVGPTFSESQVSSSTAAISVGAVLNSMASGLSSEPVKVPCADAVPCAAAAWGTGPTVALNPVSPTASAATLTAAVARFSEHRVGEVCVGLSEVTRHFLHMHSTLGPANTPQ